MSEEVGPDRWARMMEEVMQTMPPTQSGVCRSVCLPRREEVVVVIHKCNQCSYGVEELLRADTRCATNRNGYDLMDQHLRKHKRLGIDT